MKVLYVVTAFPRSETDVITPWLVTTIEKLKNQGIEVEVFTSSYKGLPNQKIRGIKVHRFRYFWKKWEDLTHEESVPDRLKGSFRYKLLLPFYLFFGLWRIYQLSRREKYSIIHCHWPLPHSLFGYIGKKVSGAKLISSFYGLEIKWLKKSLPCLLPFVRFLANKSDALTAISTYTAQEINSLGIKKKIEIIPFGAAISMESKQLEIPEKREDKTPQILFVGRLIERKGLDYLLRALAEVRKKRKVLLTIVGEGKEKKKLTDLARELGIAGEVNFTGFVPSRELARYYQMCDIFVHPAIVDAKGDAEGLGVVLLEAMSYKKPVIASRVGGIVDIIKDKETGILVSEKSVAELKDAILLLLKDSNLRKTLAENGYQFVRNNFNWDKIITQLKDLYKILIRPSRARQSFWQAD